MSRKAYASVGPKNSSAAECTKIRRSSEIEHKIYLRVPPRKPFSRMQKLGQMLIGNILSPSYWLLSHCYHVPGLRFRLDYYLMSARLLFSRSREISLSDISWMACFPMDSVRYFEFDFAWDSLSNLPIRRYLDVSSPRLLPISVTRKKSELRAQLLNPDAADLAATIKLVRALGLTERCNFHDCLIAEARFEPGSFDVVTSISVLEHIPEDAQAAERMWRLVRPGGRLLLSVMCAKEAAEEFIDHDEYGLLEPNNDGFFFFQRYYDEVLLKNNIFSVTGQPCRYAVYGEKTPGLYHRNTQAKRSGCCYPAWREPYMMGKEWRYFDTVDALPGVGVIAMEFVKG